MKITNQKNAVVTLCLMLFGVFFIAGCKKEPKDEPTPEPIEIYYECLTSMDFLGWKNLNYDEKVIIT